MAGTIDASATNLKITALKKNHFGIVVTAPAYPDGTMYNPKTAPKPVSTGLMFDRSSYGIGINMCTPSEVQYGMELSTP